MLWKMELDSTCEGVLQEYYGVLEKTVHHIWADCYFWNGSVVCKVKVPHTLSVK